MNIAINTPRTKWFYFDDRHTVRVRCMPFDTASTGFFPARITTTGA